MPQANPAREAIRKAQEILEAKQRAEEDTLLQVGSRFCHFCDRVNEVFTQVFRFVSFRFVEIQR